MTIIENVVRGIPMKFVGYTRSLELCARMNYETENLDFIDDIKPGEILFDLGACEGRFSIYAALRGIKCYSFEPEKNNYAAFLQNMEVNQILLGAITTYKLAVGESNRTAMLKIGQPWAGGHQKVVEQVETRNDLKFEFKDEELIDVISLDTFISKNELECPDYLKVDIDGSEVAFMQGAQQTLSNKKLKKIIFELESNDKNFENIISNLEENGLKEEKRFQVPNEPNLFNIIFNRFN
jgi:FkbM family methyltransferase